MAAVGNSFMRLSLRDTNQRLFCPACQKGDRKPGERRRSFHHREHGARRDGGERSCSNPRSGYLLHPTSAPSALSVVKNPAKFARSSTISRSSTLESAERAVLSKRTLRILDPNHSPFPPLCTFRALCGEKACHRRPADARGMVLAAGGGGTTGGAAAGTGGGAGGGNGSASNGPGRLRKTIQLPDWARSSTMRW
jgi:hypothetical protein